MEEKLRKNLGIHWTFSVCGGVGVEHKLQVWFSISTNNLRLKWNEGVTNPVLRPVEQVHYFEGWGVGAKSLAAKTLQIDNYFILYVALNLHKLGGS